MWEIRGQGRSKGWETACSPHLSSAEAAVANVPGRPVSTAGRWEMSVCWENMFFPTDSEFLVWFFSITAVQGRPCKTMPLIVE